MKAITFTQPTPATTWIIVHNFGHKPVVDAWVDNNGVPEKIHAYSFDNVDDNTLHITFSVPRTGGARLMGEPAL